MFIVDKYDDWKYQVELMGVSLFMESTSAVRHIFELVVASCYKSSDSKVLKPQDSFGEFNTKKIMIFRTCRES